MLNVPISDDGISKEMSPWEIVTGRCFNVEKQCRTIFGEYIEASDDAYVTNDMKPRTQACIALGSSGDEQGSVVCFQVSNVKLVRW